MVEIMEYKALTLSSCDASLPARLLQEAFDFRMQESRDLTARVYKEMVKPSNILSGIMTEGEEKVRLVIDASDDLMEKYKDGTLKLAMEKGHMVAQIREKGKYGAKLPVFEQSYRDGMSSADVMMMIQLQAIQEALATISEQIQIIDKNVKDVLIGQQNDRLALYYSGVAMFIEASNLRDESLRKQLISQAIKSLSDSIFQLTLNMQSDILYLENKEYDQNKKVKLNMINEKIDNINRSFMAIHQASIMKAAIYCMQGEMNSMAAVLQEYERFIKGTVIKNAEMLSLCDPDEKRKLDRTWKKRAEMQFEVGEIVKQLKDCNTVLYIESKED